MALSDKDNEKDSRSGSETEQEIPGKKRRHHRRHTAQQILELEALFQECQHPDENQRMELSRRLSLEAQQVKFWFQNRRTQNKTKTDRREISILRQENDKLRVENVTLREAMRNPLCNNCRGPISSPPSPVPPLADAAYTNVAPTLPEFVSSPDRDHTGMAAAGRRSMLRLAQRMTESFVTIGSASSFQKWTPVRVGSIGEGMRVMTRQSLDDEPPGQVLIAATSVWLPVAPGRVFDFLRDGRLRGEWDALSNGRPMPEMAHIVKGENPGNAVTLLRAGQSSSVLILQETCMYSCGAALVVYSPVDIPSMDLVMKGGDSGYVALLPSGLSIAHEGPPPVGKEASNGGKMGGGGTRLTLTFQILVDSLPSAKVTEESVGTVNNLISCTVQQIKRRFTARADRALSQEGTSGS